MWYEVLPPILIIAVCSAIPYYGASLINYYSLGNKKHRTFDSQLGWVGYVKDLEQGDGKMWKFNGLEAIPDK